MNSRESLAQLLLTAPIAALLYFAAVANNVPHNGAIGATIGIAITSLAFLAAGGVVLLWQAGQRA